MEITMKLNGKICAADTNDTILEAAKKNGIEIPSLCFMKGCNEIAACRMCVVEVAGMRGLPPACVTKVREGMEVLTDSPKVRKARHATLNFLAQHHRMICDQCSRYSDCEFHALCVAYGISERDYNPYKMEADKDASAPHLIRDTSKCVQCQRCVAACHNQSMDIVGAFHRGWKKKVAPAQPLAQTDCVGCGQCVAACPTGALSIRDDTVQLRNLIRQKKKHVVAVVTPAAAGGFGKLFYETEQKDNAGKLTAMLKKLGFERVYSSVSLQDAHLAAELEIAAQRKTPVISEGCPAVRNLVEKQYPQLRACLSGVGTQQAFAARFVRRFYAQEADIPEEDILVVYLNSCTAGKTETADGLFTLTTYELAFMFRRACVSRFTAMKVWREQLDEATPFDPLPKAEAATAITVTGLGAVRTELEKIQSGSYEGTLLKGAACPGGCSTGGGAPRHTSAESLE
ncbi:MAG: 2Fe-2S iron-sulfur cluster-binding protein [Clostridiales bacterium]|nr:2Fe-2S iron-sulfur cluster-binding protein [Clostridiales bacterium]